MIIMAHVSQKKKDVVDDFKKLLKEYPIVGAVNMENLPAPQLQTMRSLLRGKVVLRMTKRRLLKLAFEDAKANRPGVEKLLSFMEIGMPAVLFTKENPFKIYKTIEKNKSPAPAKAGQIAPKDIEVKAGPTPFLPGPIIGELGSIGIKTGVEGGKVAIRQDTVVVRQGQPIKASVASLLSRLGINPMEIGLDVVAIFEDGIVYTKDILSVDEKKYISDLTTAATWAFNLSVEAAIPSKDNADALIGKAFRDSKGLALERGILASGVVDEIIGNTHIQMLNLKSILNI
jgi:large subunit ribosomal protein L10